MDNPDHPWDNYIIVRIYKETEMYIFGINKTT